MTEDQIRDFLREMRDEPIPPDTRVRVRAAVIERIQSGSWASMFHGRWRIAVVFLATASIAGLLFLRPSMSVHKPAPGVAARQPGAWFERVTPLEKTAPEAKNVLQRAKHPASRMVQPAAHHTQEAPTATGGVLIRIETTDPNVVIVLVGD